MAKSRPAKNPEDLGKMLVNIYESGYLDKNQAYKQSFIKGLVSGFGGVLGATILIAVLIWILSLFTHVHLLQPFIEPVRNKIQTRQ